MAEVKEVKGKDRYNAGVISYKKMGYWQPDYEPISTDVIAMFSSYPTAGC